MFKQNIYKILSNEMLVPGVFKMRLGGDTQYITKPGQFITAGRVDMSIPTG